VYPFFLESLIGDKILIPMYGLMLATAFTVAYLYSIHCAMRRQLDPKHIENLFLILVLSSVVGSRGFHVLFENWDHFKEHPIEIFFFWQGGFTFYGGFLAAVVATVYYAHRQNLNKAKYADIATAPALIALSIGRLGCLLAGCCWGHPTQLPWGIAFNHPRSFASPPGVPLHPTQLYESLLCFLIFLHLVRVFKKPRYDGQVAVHGMALYAVVRIFVEFFRGDSYRGFLLGGLLSTSQFISLGVLAAAGYLHWYWYRRGARA
jgi:phosphatidylglycerol---prolipoprotein diacylglyceryl transferase